MEGRCSAGANLARYETKALLDCLVPAKLTDGVTNVIPAAFAQLCFGR
jgi:hypothetical protein